MKGILNLIITQWRGIYTRKSNQNIIFFNAWILPTCSFTVTLYFNFGLLVFLCMLDCCNSIFMYRICWIAGIFTYVKLLVFSGMSGLMTQRVDELFAALLQNAPVTTTVIREAKQEYDRLRVSSLWRQTLSSQILATLLCLWNRDVNCALGEHGN